jgi:hypothetical protein
VCAMLLSINVTDELERTSRRIKYLILLMNVAEKWSVVDSDITDIL